MRSYDNFIFLIEKLKIAKKVIFAVSECSMVKMVVEYRVRRRVWGGGLSVFFFQLRRLNGKHYCQAYWTKDVRSCVLGIFSEDFKLNSRPEINRNVSKLSKKLNFDDFLALHSFCF